MGAEAVDCGVSISMTWKGGYSASGRVIDTGTSLASLSSSLMIPLLNSVQEQQPRPLHSPAPAQPRCPHFAVDFSMVAARPLARRQ